MKSLFKKEIVLNALFIAILSALSMLVAIGISGGDTIEITYSVGKTIKLDLLLVLRCAFAAIMFPAVYIACLFIFKPSGNAPAVSTKNVVLFCILAVFGAAAYIAIVVLMTNFGIATPLSFLFATIIDLVYFLLVFKLYFEEKTYSNAIFWEVFRFAIVGLIAAVFDFSASFAVQFAAFKNVEGWYVTLVATACGFLVGVLINYLLSTYMVYKAAKSDFSKSFKGIAVFVALSAIGLMIGIGLQYFLYDFLCVLVGVTFLSYPVDFVIRTLVVMVYNYVSRKLVIYR